jgi:hypothetical protein
VYLNETVTRLLTYFYLTEKPQKLDFFSNNCIGPNKKEIEKVFLFLFTADLLFWLKTEKVKSHCSNESFVYFRLSSDFFNLHIFASVSWMGCSSSKMRNSNQLFQTIIFSLRKINNRFYPFY